MRLVVSSSPFRTGVLKIQTIPIACILLLCPLSGAFAQQAPVPERSFAGANHLTIQVREVVPGGQPSSIQVVCYLKHRATGDTTLAAVADLDRKLGGIVSALRNSNQFEGNPLETLYFESPQDSIKAPGVMLVGVGDEQQLSLDTMKNVGVAALRNAMLLNASSISFAAALQDQNVKKLDVGDVAGAVVSGVILAYDTYERLQRLGLVPQRSIRVWTYEAGPKFFQRTVDAVAEAVKKANGEVDERRELK